MLSTLGKFWIRHKKRLERMKLLKWFFSERDRQLQEDNPKLWEQIVEEGYENPFSMEIERLQNRFSGQN